MSLDVWLTEKDVRVLRTRGSGIFVREDGCTKEITEEEWNRRHPGRVPVRFVDENEDECSDTVFDANITHNLNHMAGAVTIGSTSLYQYLWRPDELQITRAGDLIEPLGHGLDELSNNPMKYKAFNPDNGWGSYDGLVSFVGRYLAACREHPDAVVHVSR